MLGFKTGALLSWKLFIPSGKDDFYFSNSTIGSVLTMRQDGNVGIGTTNPSSRMTVDKGNIQIRGTQEWGDIGDTAKLILGDPNHGLASIYGQGLRLWTFGDGTHSIEFGKHNGTNYMTIDGSGCVAINSSIDINERLSVYQLSGPNQVAIHGRSGVSNPSFGGGIGVKGSFSSDGVGGIGVFGGATSIEHFGNVVGVYGYTDDPTSYAIYGEGGMAATGPIASIVETRSYGYREIYATHSPGNWCQDFGTASLVNGEAVVHIDPVYSETVNMSTNYHVFLTPMGDCDLYIAEKLPDQFIVRSRDCRSSNIDFDYQIVSRRRGMENKRLQSADNIMETTAAVHRQDKRK
jgi:hypothetical protein